MTPSDSSGGDPAGPRPSADASADAERSWLVLAHLSQFVTFVGVPGFVGPLGVWLIKGGEDPIVAREAKEALNFSLSLLVYAVGLVVLLATGVLGTAFVDGGLSILALVGIGWAAVALGSLVLPIVAAVQTSRERPYRYPLTIRFFDGAPR